MSCQSAQRKPLALSGLISGLFMLLLTACNPGNLSALALSANQTHEQLLQSATTQVQQPTGTAHLDWNALSKTLVVTLTLSGLAPSSRHPAHIHLTNCVNNGPIKYMLNDVVADQKGNAFTATSISDVAAGIPVGGWYINVHNGPGLNTPRQIAPIYCGNVRNPRQLSELNVPLDPIYSNQFAQNSTVASTIPGNGDVNPYGVAVVKASIGRLTRGNILVSNFNNGLNQQGTGTTIVQISPTGAQHVFARLAPSACPDGIGLTTALVELKRGWVIVGSLPAANGQFANAKAGCLIVLDSLGHVVTTWTGQQINGPWDATVQENANGDAAALYFTNILNGTVAANTHIVNQGTVERFDLYVPQGGVTGPTIQSMAMIGMGYAEKTDAAALVIGPTGLGLGNDGTLFVSDPLNNRIVAIPHAQTRPTPSHANEHVFASGGTINGPLGLLIAPNGNLIVVNGNDGNLVELAPDATQLTTRLISSAGSPPGAGCLFGLALIPSGKGLYFVDDCSNQLNSLT